MYALLMRLKPNYNKEKYTYLHLIQKGDTVIEAGANVGYFTQLFAQIIGKSGELHTFEPAPSTFTDLKRHCVQAQLPRFPYLNCLGLSNKEGAATIHMPKGDSGQASLIPHHIGSWGHLNTSSTHSILLTTLDAYVEQNKLQKLDFLKLDIEGAELLALEGSLRSLERFHPLIHTEVCSHFLKDFGANVNDLIRLLENLGYDRFFAYETDINNPSDLRKLTEEDLKQSLNVVCASSDLHKDRLKRMHWA
jgi:FkbM family methyltransferase